MWAFYKACIQFLEAMPYQQLSKAHGTFRRLVLLTVLATLLHFHGATAQSPSADPDNNNNGVPLNGTVNGTVYAWCDYGLQNVAGAGGLINISETSKYGSGSGARIHTAQRYTYGNFSARIKCPAGDTSGLVPNFYVSSGETGQSNPTQDEIDFEWLGKNQTIVQVTYFVNGNSSSNGTDNGAKLDLGFDCSEAFHEYTIEWTPDYIRWHIDGQVVKTAYNRTGLPFPSKPTFLYSGLWDGSDIANGQWAGSSNYKDAPYVFQLSDVTIKPYGANATAIAPAPAPTETPAAAPIAAPPTTTENLPGFPADPPAVSPDVTEAPTAVPATNVSPVAPINAQDGKAGSSKLILPVSIAGAALAVLLVGGVTFCVLMRRRKVHATAGPGAEDGLAKTGLAARSGVDEETGSASPRPSLMQQVSMRLNMRHLDSKGAGSFVRVQL